MRHWPVFPRTDTVPILPKASVKALNRRARSAARPEPGFQVIPERDVIKRDHLWSVDNDSCRGA